MINTAHAVFSAKTWDEKPYVEIETGRKLTRAQATYVYTGELEGEGSVEYLMAYRPDGSGSFVGIERIVGRLGGRSGSLIVRHTGMFGVHSVNTHWEFLPDLGTDALAGVRGGGELQLAGQGPYPFHFEYQWPEG